jgi:hypothetical protein
MAIELFLPSVIDWFTNNLVAVVPVVKVILPFEPSSGVGS